jgi:hypothetical protein
MSSGDFETEVRQSVADHLALIQTAAAAAKTRIVTSVDFLQTVNRPVASPVDFSDVSAGDSRRPAVDFSADEPAFSEEPVFAEMDAFADAGSSSVLPNGAITFDDLAVENVDDEGIPVWEDAP